MKKILLIIPLLFLFNCLNAQYHERDWNWEPYASLVNDGKTYVVLYYGKLIKGYNGEIRWRVANRGIKPLKGVTLAAQTYILEDSTLVKRDERNFKTRSINAGESAMTLPVKVETQQQKGVIDVELEKPELILDFGSGKELSWNKLGEIQKSIY